MIVVMHVRIYFYSKIVGLLEKSRQLIANALHRIPFIRRYYSLVNRFYLSCHCKPIVSTKMWDGTSLKLDLGDSIVARVYYFHKYNTHLLSELLKYVKPRDIFIDIGANIGFYSIAIANHMREQNMDAKVLAYEPVEGNYLRLLENINANYFQEYISVFKTGLSDDDGDAWISLRAGFRYGSKTGNAAIIYHSEQKQNFKCQQIRLRRLDDDIDVIEALNRPIGVMKIDIEGHEDYCLRGARRLLETYRPVVLMEVNKYYYRDRGVDLEKAFCGLLPDGYQMYRLECKEMVEIRSLKNCDEIDDVFLIPREKLLS